MSDIAVERSPQTLTTGRARRILILGASYGSLLATKLVLAKHTVRMVCLPAEAEIFNREGAIVRMPVTGREDQVEVRTAQSAGRLSAVAPADARPADHDLVVLAMQEPQYRQPEVRELLAAIGKSRVPCMSIMNMPPLPYLKRIPGLDVEALHPAYGDPAVWDVIDPALLTLCSPDPQAYRPPQCPLNVLQVRLATNFKAARFEREMDTSLLRGLGTDIEAVRFDAGDGVPVELPVKLKVHDSLFVPLAKWSMLVAGNYRCVQEREMRSIKETVYADLEATRAVYDWVADLCVALGAARSDMVPFEKYAAAARSLESPSSAARALAAGARDIERVDVLVRLIAAQHGRRLQALEDTVGLVDRWLDRNRRKQ